MSCLCPSLLQKPQEIGQRGLREILSERGLVAPDKKEDGLSRADLVEIMAAQPDFAGESTLVEQLAMFFTLVFPFFGRTMALFTPRFHPEVNWIEMYWAVVKDYLRGCDTTHGKLRKLFREAVSGRHCLNRVSASPRWG